jgi:hypothetical protein
MLRLNYRVISISLAAVAVFSLAVLFLKQKSEIIRQVTPNDISGSVLQERVSASGKYLFSLQKLSKDFNEDRCAVLLRADDGSVSRLFLKSNLSGIFNCGEIPAGTTDPFVTWTKSDELITYQNNIISIYNPRTKSDDIVQHDKNYNLVTTDDTGSTFVYIPKSNPSNEIVISGKEFSTVNKLSLKSDMAVGYNLFQQLYDQTNKGFVITLKKSITKNDDTLMSVKIYFYDISKKKLSIVLDSKNTSIGNAFPYSCVPSNIVSSRIGEIVLDGSCLIVDKKYLKEGLIMVRI